MNATMARTTESVVLTIHFTECWYGYCWKCYLDRFDFFIAVNFFKNSKWLWNSRILNHNVLFTDTVTISTYKKKSKQPVLQNVQLELVSMLLKYLNAQQELLLQTEQMETKSKWDVQIYLNLVPSCDAVTSVTDVLYLS